MSTASASRTSPQATGSSSSSSSSPSASNSISLIRLDELSSFGATKQNRLPALIKLNPLADSQQQQPQQVQQQQSNGQQQQQQQQEAASMPDFSASQVEKMAALQASQQAESLPAALEAGLRGGNKENAPQTSHTPPQPRSLNNDDSADDFQVVEMEEGETGETGAAGVVGPSLPAPKTAPRAADKQQAAGAPLSSLDAKSLSAQLQSANLTGQYASHLGDSLIEMIINLRNENQNLIRALETNSAYVKERLSEFKRCQEEAKRRELQHAAEKAELEHQARKTRRQNEVLSERLSSLEAQLREMNVEIGQSLTAAHSSRASSIRGEQQAMYPQLSQEEASFSNSALLEHQAAATTMQIDAISGELHNQHDQDRDQDQDQDQDLNLELAGGQHSSVRLMDTGGAGTSQPERVGSMSKEALGRHFDARKAPFSAPEDHANNHDHDHEDDHMKQCDQLEQQLNDIGRRDYEICLLQQQLNIYRQDFRLERMAKLEAKLQIERLKSDIDRLCVARVQEREQEAAPTTTTAGANLIGKLGHHLGKKAVRSAAKAAKYAAKQAHLEEKAAAAMARATAARAAAGHFTAPKPTTELGQQTGPTGEAGAAGPAPHGHHAHSRHHHHHHHDQHQHHHRGHHRNHFAAAAAAAPATGPQGGGAPSNPLGSRPHRGAGPGGIRSEVMNDLLSTANKAMLTGYKMASTHVNLALDKLSQYEQQQASQLSQANKPPIQGHTASGKGAAGPTAPPMEPPSID